MATPFVLKGVLEGHSGWVSALAPVSDKQLLSASRDKTVIIWELEADGENYGYAKKSLVGHNHFVEDLAISADGAFALTGSWDGTLRLWDLESGDTTVRFIGHEKDVLSVAFNEDNTKIVSGSRDKSIKLWNVLGDCKYTIKTDGHTDWVSCVRFSPIAAMELIVSAGWDKLVKVWEMSSCKLRKNFAGHTGYVSSVTISPDGSLCASGGKDGVVHLCDLTEGKDLYTLNTNGAVIHSLAFSPNRYWLCAATSRGVCLWDLETKELVAEVVPDYEERGPKALVPQCLSVCWSKDGDTLFAGSSNNNIYVWGLAAGGL